VVCGPDGVAIFDALRRRGTVSEAMLYAFDLIELDGEDLRGLPLSDRKKRLARLVGRRRLGIVLSDHPTRTAPCYSCTLASWAWKASSRRS
jgi:bifunctional non-homologous end joining protein LigD